MPAGGPGDHPLTDILNYEIEVYDFETDNGIRQLSQLLSRRELDAFWESDIGWECATEVAGKAVREKLTWALQRAESSGWEQQ